MLTTSYYDPVRISDAVRQQRVERNRGPDVLPEVGQGGGGVGVLPRPLPPRPALLPRLQPG